MIIDILLYEVKSQSVYLWDLHDNSSYTNARSRTAVLVYVIKSIPTAIAVLDKVYTKSLSAENAFSNSAT